VLSVLKWIFFSVSVGSVFLAAFFMLTAEHSIQEVLDAAAIQAGSRVDHPDIKAYDNNQLSWRLQAKSAQEKGDILVLERPFIDLYTQEREVIPMQAKNGKYDKKKGLVHMKGKVVVGYQDWILRSETLYYQQKKDEIHVPGAFTMRKPDVNISGKNMRVSQKKGRLSIIEGVHMVINEEMMAGKP